MFSRTIKIFQEHLRGFNDPSWWCHRSYGDIIGVMVRHHPQLQTETFQPQKLWTLIGPDQRQGVAGTTGQTAESDWLSAQLHCCWWTWERGWTATSDLCESECVLLGVKGHTGCLYSSLPTAEVPTLRCEDSPGDLQDLPEVLEVVSRPLLVNDGSWWMSSFSYFDLIFNGHHVNQWLPNWGLGPCEGSQDD